MKKKIILISSIVLILLIAVASIFIFLHTKETKARQQVVDQWVETIEKQQFDQIPTLVTENSILKHDFTTKTVVDKYETVFSGLHANKITISSMKEEKVANQRYKLTYTMNVETALGEITDLHYTAFLTKQQKDYKLDWHPGLIFPHMEKTDRVRYTIKKPTRGSIIDRNGQPLATNAPFYSLGVIPKELGTGDERTKNMKAISDEFSISTETIEKKLQQKWVKDDLFVPLKIVNRKEVKVLQGAQYKATEIRYYPLGQAAAQLIGYTGTVTAEDLEKNPKLSDGDTIGKTGLEATFDQRLRGQTGGDIAVVTSSGRVRDVLLHADETDGEMITLTIDTQLQKAAFDALEKSVGASVVMDPKNGDLKALVSKPSYDPNKMVRGISQEDYDAYANDENLPFLNRFTNRYAPGSTLKTLTAAIGLDNGTTTPTKTHEIKGLQWQKDKSWGSYYITRLHDDVSTVNYVDALIYSDNIFFAKEALDMGEKKLRDGLNQFAFNKQFDLPFAMKAAQISKDDSFNSDILLADTAYGQGEVLMSPIQQAVSYATFANDGKMVEPKLLLDANVKTTQVMKEDTAHKVRDAMIQVVEHKGGTGNTLQSLKLPIAAKTGTAEMKQKQGVYDGTENSLVVAFNPKKENYLLLTIVENHKKTHRTAIELSKSLIPVLDRK